MFSNIIVRSTSDKEYNEDGYGFRDDVVFVIDGATGLGENNYMGYGDDAKWFVSTGNLENHAYDFQDQEIKILFKTKECTDISIASDQLDRHFLEKTVTKYYLSFPKEFDI